MNLLNRFHTRHCCLTGWVPVFVPMSSSFRGFFFAYIYYLQLFLLESATKTGASLAVFSCKIKITLQTDLRTK